MMNVLTLESIKLSELTSVSLEGRRGLPECAGVYIVFDADSVVLYVGRSVNIRARWTSHHRRKDLQAIDGIRIAWIEVTDVLLLPTFEAGLIARFNPKLNFSIRSLSEESLSQLRIKAGLRSVNVAYHLGVADSSIRNWESGRNVPTLTFAQIRQLMELYDCTFEKLEEAIKQSMMRDDCQYPQNSPALSEI